jgi:hypothetical protein
MVKILRKYNKFFLVGFGVVLMVTFLLPAGFGQGGFRSSTVARLGDKKIGAEEWERSSLEYAAIQQIAPFMQEVIRIDDDTHWLLLTREAQQGGFIGEAGDGPGMINDLADYIAPMIAQQQGRPFQQLSRDEQQQIRSQAVSFLEQRRAQVGGSVRLKPMEIDMALAKARGVLRMLSFYASAAKISDRRFVETARERLDGVVVDFSSIPAENIDLSTWTPSEEEILAHFEKYRGIRRGEGEMGFGYLQSPRVKLEWVTLDPVVIGSQVRLDPVEVNKRWQVSRTRFPGEFFAEQPKVEAEIRTEKVRAIVADAMQVIRAEVLRVSRELPADGKFVKLPSATEWEQIRPKADKLAAAVVASAKSKHNVDIPTPVIGSETSRWLDQSALSGLAGIGMAEVRLGGRTLPAAQALLSVRELNPQIDLGYQVGVTPVENVPADAEGRRFYFTVLDSRPEGPPESIEEVRERVITDLKSKRAFETLAADAEKIRLEAAANGIEAAVKPYTKPGTRPDGTPNMPPFVGKLQRFPVAFQEAELKPVNDAIKAAIAGFDPKTPATTTSNDPNHFIAIPLPRQQQVLVMRIAGVSPATVEMVRTQVDQGWFEIQRRELVAHTSASGPFSLEALKSRMNFRMARSSGEAAKPEPASEQPSSSEATPGQAAPASGK